MMYKELKEVYNDMYEAWLWKSGSDNIWRVFFSMILFILLCITYVVIEIVGGIEWLIYMFITKIAKPK